MNFADLVDYAGIEEYALGAGGFARVDVRRYAYISCVL
jgi:hypothetical protein